MKLLDYGEGRYAFYCHGCGHNHVYYTGEQEQPQFRWQFNGDMNTPTFTPSLLNRWGKYADPNWKEPKDAPPGNKWSGICHLFVTNGMIHYCGDCTHEYAGKQNVPMRDMDEVSTTP